MTDVAVRDPSAELAAALAKVQAELPEVGKNRTADVSNKEGRKLYSYSYADLADVSAAVLPVLGRHGLAFTAFPGHQADGKFGLKYYLLHSSGGSLEGFFEIDDHGGMQMVGGRITYARRYTLCAVTGITADEDVDARDDGQNRTLRRQSPSGNGHQSDNTAQRKPRPQTSPPAPPVPSGPTGAERDGPPLPGEEDAPGPVPEAAGPGAPDDTDYDTPGTATGPQVQRIWVTLKADFGYTDAQRDEARAVCARIVNRELASSKELSHSEASTVIDALSGYAAAAMQRGDHPRDVLNAVMKRVQDDPRGGDGQEGDE